MMAATFWYAAFVDEQVHRAKFVNGPFDLTAVRPVS
jgi:hypothetical protein